jgi:hypothetical protein
MISRVEDAVHGGAEHAESAACRSSSGTGKSIAPVANEALANPSIERFVDPADIAALAVVLAADHARSILD